MGILAGHSLVLKVIYQVSVGIFAGHSLVIKLIYQVSMNPSRRAMVCFFAADDSSDSFQPLLWSVLNHAPLAQIELRMGFLRAELDFCFALGELCPDLVTPQYCLLQEDIERYQWFGREGLRLRAWRTVPDRRRPRRHSLEQMRRLAIHDVPLETEYTVFLDGDVAVQPGWWETLLPRMDRGVDYIGQPAWREYGPREIEKIQTKPWYVGVPFERRSGRAGVAYMQTGIIAVRSERLRGVKDVDEVSLGEIGRQMGWTREEVPCAAVAAAVG
jgi:hypothetical protein